MCCDSTYHGLPPQAAESTMRVFHSHSHLMAIFMHTAIVSTGSEEIFMVTAHFLQIQLTAPLTEVTTVTVNRGYIKNIKNK